MAEPITVKLRADVSEIARLALAVADFARAHQLPDSVAFDVNLALEEIIVNTISYGYEDRSGHEIVVRLALRDRQLTVEIEDDARPFNPLEVPEPDLSQPLEERRVGGLGIHLVRKLFEQLEYHYEAGRNILVLRKRV